MRADGGQVELVDYPLFDALADGYGISGLAASTVLFAANNQGRPQFTNQEQAAVIPSGGIYVVTGMRAWHYFQSLNDSEYNQAYGTLPPWVNCTSTSARMQDCNQMLANNAQVTFTIAQKPMFTCPWWWFPAGGGNTGYSLNWARSIITHGVPGKHAAGKFVKPLKVASLQAYKAIVTFYDIGRNAAAGAFTGNGQGGALATDISPLNFFNQADGIKQAFLFMVGAMSRDIS